MPASNGWKIPASTNRFLPQRRVYFRSRLCWRSEKSAVNRALVPSLKWIITAPSSRVSAPTILRPISQYYGGP